ncbi:hypothetical protein [Oceanospirillum linum]|uniref:Uncharacterized protein n=1 Tax=Oceanospirillum linum TaxID=966 RepID=A0A1T1HBT1_OCELI|nr:hypothetical protein [Oceanospirillum linum]OOV87272.1 hypothetical protein BTA35_0209850 [Oceanospirillum linum]SEF79629.1 hypothetical protein SAMN04489856_102368 [Oleiphilus messinensis]SMP18532.1 hypothetical protein SAMN06264348_103369 [Oceanospirillum linum]
MTTLDQSRETLPDDTPIYKYIDKKTFFDYYLNTDQPTLLFRNIHEWYDSHEGRIKGMLKAFDSKTGIAQETQDIQSYLGSCWALCTDDERLYDSNIELELANNELVKFGSDAMWQTYCPEGGVRIQTTIGKLRGILEGFEYLHGRMKYATQRVAVGRSRTGIKDGALFIKRIPFRHENEYRFIITLPKQTQSLSLQFELMDLVDEFLVSPKKKQGCDSEQIKKAITKQTSYQLADFHFTVGERETKPRIRISELYDKVLPATAKK